MSARSTEAASRDAADRRSGGFGELLDDRVGDLARRLVRAFVRALRRRDRGLRERKRLFVARQVLQRAVQRLEQPRLEFDGLRFAGLAVRVGNLRDDGLDLARIGQCLARRGLQRLGLQLDEVLRALRRQDDERLLRVLGEQRLDELQVQLRQLFDAFERLAGEGERGFEGS